MFQEFIGNEQGHVTGIKTVEVDWVKVRVKRFLFKMRFAFKSILKNIIELLKIWQREER